MLITAPTGYLLLLEAVWWRGATSPSLEKQGLFWSYLNAERYQDEILLPVAISYLHSLEQNSVLQDENTRPHRAGFIRDYLQNLGVERMEWPACSQDLNPTEHLWDQLELAKTADSIRSRMNNTIKLADFQQMLVEDCDAVPQLCVTSTRRRCQAFVPVYGSSTVC